MFNGYGLSALIGCGRLIMTRSGFSADWSSFWWPHLNQCTLKIMSYIIHFNMRPKIMSNWESMQWVIEGIFLLLRENISNKLQTEATSSPIIHSRRQFVCLTNEHKIVDWKLATIEVKYVTIPITLLPYSEAFHFHT